MKNSQQLTRFVALTVALAPFAATAADYQWNGSTDSDWTKDSNWTGTAPADSNVVGAHRLNVNGSTALVYSSAQGSSVFTGGTGSRGLVIGSGSAGNGTMEITGGSFSTAGSSANDIIANTGNTGALIVSGGNFIGANVATEVGFSNGTGSLTISGNGSATLNTLQLGTPGTTGSTQLRNKTVNLDGGTLSINLLSVPRTEPNAVINLNGGTLSPRQNTSTFFDANLDRANVRDGGTIIDTAGFDVAIATPLVHSNIAGDASIDGGLTKKGAGTLTLTADAHTYTGPTKVEAGTLSTTTGSQLSDISAVHLTTGATLNLDHSENDLVGGLIIDGVPQASGLWGRVGSISAFGADHESSLITGDGLLENIPPFYWDGTGTAWSDAASWTFVASDPSFNPPAAPGIVDTPIFAADAVVADETVELGGDRTVDGVRFVSPVLFHLLGGGITSSLSLGAAGIELASGSGGAEMGSTATGQEVNLILDTTQTWTNISSTGVLTANNGIDLQFNDLTFAGSGAFAIPGAIIGSGNLTKSGSGSLILSGTNSYSGDTTVTGGSLTVVGDASAVTGNIFVGPESTTSAMNIGSLTQTADTIVVVNSGNTVQLGKTSTSNTGYTPLIVRGSPTNPTTVTNHGSLMVARVSLLQVNTNTSWTQTGDATILGVGGYSDTIAVNGGSFTYTGSSDFAITPATNNSGSATLNIQFGGNFTTSTGFAFGSGGTGSGIASINLASGGRLTLAADIPSLVTGASTGKVRLGDGGGIIDTAGFDSELTYPLENRSTETGSLTKEGAGTLVLTGLNTYSGDTTVTAGTLSLAQANTSNDSSTVAISSGAALNLAYAGTDDVDKLFLNGVQQPAGVYGSGNSGGLITGTGTLTVATGPAGGFSTWIAGFAVGSENQPGDDPDNDGIENLLEFVLNGNPAVSGNSILPNLVVTATAFEFTYQRRDDSLAPETTQTFQWGTTLGIWAGSAVIPASSATVGVATVTVTDGSPTDTVKISIPKTEAGGSGKLFGRLRVTKP